MKAETNLILGSTLFILMFGLFSSYLLNSITTSSSEAITGSWACTTELRQCPDGSLVGRTPPYCQFACNLNLEVYSEEVTSILPQHDVTTAHG